MAILLTGLITSGVTFWLVGSQLKAKQPTSFVQPNLQDMQKYSLLAPEVLAVKNEDLRVNFVPLRQKLRELVNAWGENFGFYFEYLPTGTSIGVHEKNNFYGASLVKVPLVMAFIKADRETNLDIDNTKVVLRSEDLDPGFGDLYKKGAGFELTLRQAVELTLTDSDNTAARILAARVPIDQYNAIYNNLDLEIDTKDNEIILTPKSYTSIMKALFYSSILNSEDSQYILTLLSQTKFSDKLPNPITKDIKVAHKIGNYENKVFQDCGIIYLPNKPYALCMMSQFNETLTTERMVSISRIVYQYLTTGKIFKNN